MQELGSDRVCHAFVQLSKSKLGGAVNGNKEVEFAIFRSNLGDVDVKVADRIFLESALLWRPIRYLRQPAEAMPLQTAMRGERVRCGMVL
jgi:hypothetical protein